jgi:hypothetical protein
MNPRWPHRPLVTEPRALASGIRAQSAQERLKSSEMVKLRLDPAHYHHPTRAARVGTPVRSRFCNFCLADDVHVLESKDK